jgi:putative hydrolase of the HAD superfamily
MRKPMMWVFDLDDTLYSERSYVTSALSFAGKMVEKLYKVPEAGMILQTLYNSQVSDPIGALWDQEGLPEVAKLQIIAAMRAHRPTIYLYANASPILSKLKRSDEGFGIMTDGRSVTQRAKLAVLGCLDARSILISEESGWEKPDPRCYAFFHNQFPKLDFCYVGDNPKKDFIGANGAGWLTVMLRDSGCNVHSQSVTGSPDLQAMHAVTSWKNLGELIDEYS